MHRGDILENAHAHTIGDREDAYGSPRKNLADCAGLWNAYLGGRYAVSPVLTAEDVAQFNVLQKIARTFSGSVKADTFEDEAAYAAIAGELSGPDDQILAETFSAPKR